MLDNTDRAALRTCALLCWERRDQLQLGLKDVEQVLIAWSAVGNPNEAEAAAELLAALRKADLKQLKFTQLLKADEKRG
jgi:hypothetical protein